MKICFPVGDWSGDGHELCEEFLVETAEGVTLEQVREAHFGLLTERGLDVGNLCRLFEDNVFHVVRSTDEGDKIIGRAQFSTTELLDAGFPLAETVKKFSSDVEVAETDIGISYNNMQPHDVFVVWVDLLNWHAPELGLREVQPDPIPGIYFYGQDDKGRHLNTPGYGCFNS